MSIIAGMFSPGVAVTINLDTTMPQPVEYTGKSTAIVPSQTIWWVKSSTGGCIVRIEDATGPGGGITVVHSTDTAAVIAAAAQTLFAVTQSGDLTDPDYPTGAFYVNSSLFQGVVAESTGSFLSLGTKSANARLYITEAPAAIIAALATTVPSEPIPVVSVATGATITTTENVAIVNMTAAGPGTVTLPVAVVGNMLYLNNTSAFDITVDGNGAETIDGGADTVVPAGSTLIVYSAALLAWQSAVGQVGNTRVFYTNDVRPADSASPINVAGVGGGVNISETTGDAKLQTASGNTVVETATGIVLIQATGAASQVIVDGGPTNPVDIDGLSMLVPDGGVYFQTGTNVGLQGDGIGDELYFRFNNAYPLVLGRTSANSVHGMTQEGYMTFAQGTAITGAADPGFPLVRTVNEVTTNAATHGVLLNSGSNFVIITAGAGIAADVQVRSALGVVVDTIAAGVTKQFINFGGVTGWKSFTL